MRVEWEYNDQCMSFTAARVVLIGWVFLKYFLNKVKSILAHGTFCTIACQLCGSVFTLLCSLVSHWTHEVVATTGPYSIRIFFSLLLALETLQNPANTRRWPNAGLLLAHSLRR